MGVGISMSAIGTGAGIATTVGMSIYGLPGAFIGVSVAAPVACAYQFLLGNGALTAKEIKEQVAILKQQDEKREEQLKEAREQLLEMKIHNTQREEQLHKSATQILEQAQQLEDLHISNDKYQSENSRLAKEVARLGDLVVCLDHAEQGLKKQLVQSQAQLVKQEDQIKRLGEIHVQLRLALQNLSVAGDTFNQFGGILSQHAQTLSEKIENLSNTSNQLNATASVLNDLTNSLQHHIVERGLK
jgi:chromosome segregation ATPase